MSIEPFTIPTFSTKQLDLLKQKLEHIVEPQELEQDIGWKLGAPKSAVKSIAHAWLHTYDWEAVRAKMNRWHNYRVTIEGLKIHFIHEPSANPDAIPLVLLNGWPSTCYEYHKVIETLRDGVNGGQAFHVVIPSLPGFGFSDGPKQINFGTTVAHGSDFGSGIAALLATKYKQHCRAYHTSMAFFLPPLPTLTNLATRPIQVAKFIASIAMGLEAVYGNNVRIVGRGWMDAVNDSDAGYRCIQATKPYTLAHGLSDSPVGLMAWILEKYHNWTHRASEDQILPDTVTTEDFLTQVTIYWLTNSISTSIRLYHDAIHEFNNNQRVYIDVPMGAAIYAGEMLKIPREWAQAEANLQQWIEYDIGGHFPALEVPEIFVQDLQKYGKLLKSKQYF
ncbi:Alpha/Beta hydrolase protein [Dichotomocladium elegans]|nr:Alpha/Beta hydrolase protein [Dichotomocladium elegans]